MNGLHDKRIGTRSPWTRSASGWVPSEPPTTSRACVPPYPRPGSRSGCCRRPS